MKTVVTFFTLFLLLGNAKAQQAKPSTPVDDAIAAQAAGNADTTNYDRLFYKVEKEAKFPGGIGTWQKFLERNLDASVTSKDHLKPGTYTVDVQFIVDKDGNVSDVHATEKVKACPHCLLAAEKVIKSGPKWSPAIFNGRNVKYQATQPISFTVIEQ